MPIEPRRLTAYHGFRDGADWDDSVLPWPEPTDVLLRPYVEGESWIYPLERWVPDQLERLTYFAMQYHDMAQEAAKSWLRTHDHRAENYILVIAYLYRHAIELRLKSCLVETPTFRRGDDRAKRTMIEGHSILGLWQRLVPDLPAEAAGDEPMMTGLLTQLHDLDTRSDGFRYPYRFGRDDQPHPIIQNMDGASAENLIWVLESILNWLDTIPDAFQRQRDFETEMARDAGF